MNSMNLSLTLPTAVYAIWMLVLLVVIVVIVPLAIALLHRTLRAAMSDPTLIKSHPNYDLLLQYGSLAL